MNRVLRHERRGIRSVGEPVHATGPDSAPNRVRRADEVENGSRSRVYDRRRVYFAPSVVVLIDGEQDFRTARRIGKTIGDPAAHDRTSQRRVVGLADENL
jgi:hypothetical protein